MWIGNEEGDSIGPSIPEILEGATLNCSHVPHGGGHLGREKLKPSYNRGYSGLESINKLKITAKVVQSARKFWMYDLHGLH